MTDTLTLQLNGQSRSFPGLTAPAPLSSLIEVLGLKADRIAVEHNGEIAARSTWSDVQVSQGDRVEIVHFVGGGAGKAAPPAIAKANRVPGA